MNNHWQHMCVTVKQRKHKILFSRNDMQIQLRLNVDISFPKEGKFEIGAQKNGDSYVQLFVGTVTCLNIWSVAIPESCVRTMAGGVMNVKGDLLAWRNVPEYIVGNLIMVPNTNIYNPGEYGNIRFRGAHSEMLHRSAALQHEIFSNYLSFLSQLQRLLKITII